MVATLFAEQALLPDGWARNVAIGINSDGTIASIEAGASAEGLQRVNGPVLPGMVNLHSHAFQRAMAGLTEVALKPDDSFWSWRELMYRLVGRLQPDQVGAIAAFLYIEMLKGGYTSVAEFHYLHHDVDGRPYADPAEMSRCILNAAEATGIRLTLLPVMYAHGGFGGKDPSAAQRRFIHDPEAYLGLLETLEGDCANGRAALGASFHSLRAVTPEEMTAVQQGMRPGLPIHIHIAEQQKEVEDCLAWSGKRPIQYLYDGWNVDQRWCLVHATHADEAEVTRMAKSGAVVGLCPTTEANLGDGLFPAVSYTEQGGRFGIGSDSHVSTTAFEELRWLEYGQRLKHERRNRLHGGGQNNVGTFLYEAALQGGALAMGQKVGRIEAGAKADLLVLDSRHPLLANVRADDILGRWIFAGASRMIRDVMVAGDWVIQDGRHPDEIEAGRTFAAAMRPLFED
ncbi:formimidoylglutamate deiminase [Dongia sedimenti]|uniref:Formimidoylglutamate deiminase n=1 Tax=Dongia sedimenti TaxID=3064282 RepID=A0ABU0YMR0_9PROT|nr:formimidoylglutamate deiminase [Rhodospirillaceae bacterium R-7]